MMECKGRSKGSLYVIKIPCYTAEHIVEFTPPSHQLQSTKSIIMSAPSADAPNEGIVGQISNSVQNAAQYVSESVQGKTAEASKEANKEKAKGNDPSGSSLSDRASGALGAASDKMDQTKHDASSKANKESI